MCDVVSNYSILSFNELSVAVKPPGKTVKTGAAI